MKLPKLLGLCLLPVFAIAMTGCGDMSLGQKVRVLLDPVKKSAKVEVEMSSGLEVGMEGTFPIKEYGNVYFVAATKTDNARIGVEVSIEALMGKQLDFPIVSTLPNGAPLPVAVTAPLLSIPVLNNSNFDVKAALSLTPELQLAAMIGINKFSSKFVIPAVALCQNFRNAEKKAFAAICLYGPSADNTKAGGIFLGGTFGEVIPSNIIASPAPAEIALTSRSALFALSSSAATAESAKADLNLKAVNMTSKKWDNKVFDPKNKVYTSEGQKSLDNARKVLSVRR